MTQKDLLPWALPITLSLLGIVSAYIVAKVRKPPAWAEMWAEMRKLRADLGEMDTRVADLRIYRDVVDILLPHIDAIIPNLTPDELKTVERARQLREARTD